MYIVIIVETHEIRYILARHGFFHILQVNLREIRHENAKYTGSRQMREYSPLLEKQDSIIICNLYILHNIIIV